MSGSKSFTAKVNKEADWIRRVLGDRLTEADELIVISAARQIVIADELYNKVQKLNGDFVQTISNGTQAPAVEYTMWQQAEKKVLDYSNKLGLNPVSRKETLKTPPEQNTDLSTFEEEIQ